VKLRGALFGCGMISEYHLRAWNRIPEVEIVGLGNRTPAKAEERRAQFAPAARVYSGMAEMLDRERPDFVDILTAPALHAEHCRIARDAGVHIICQKPLAGSLEDAHAIAADFRTYPKLFAVHENHRYRPWFQKACKSAREGLFGRIRYARFEHLNAIGPREAYKSESEQGVMLEYGSHLVDMMCALFGSPKRAYCRMHHLNPNITGESLVHAVYEYPDLTAVVECGWKDAAITQGSVLLAGDDGEFYYEGTLTRGNEGQYRISRKQEVQATQKLVPMEAYMESFYLLQRECADFMLGHRASVTQTIGEHLRSLSWTFAAYESARRGEAVSL
jgi:predicted dehydrogenase